MRRLLLSLAFTALASTAALAQSASGAQSNNAVDVNVATYGAEIPRNTRVTTTGAAIAPGLAAGAIVCAQSTSAAGGFMGGAFSFGTTREDKDCNDRAWIATLGAMAGATRDGRYLNAGHNVACANKTAGRALREAGFACPGDRPTQVRSANRQPTYTTKRMRIADMAPGTVYILNGKRHVKR